MKSALKLFVVLLVILGTSCKKDNAEAKRRLAALTKAPWIILKIEEKNADGSWKDITGNPSPIDADNLRIFGAYGYYEENEGPLKLPGNPQIQYTGQWIFTEKANKIQIINAQLMDIVELNDTKFQVTVNKTSTVERVTFGHP